AQKLLADKQYPQVQAEAQKLHEALADAYFVAHRPRTAEFRAVWNHSGTGDCGTWDEAMQALRAGGFNAVVPNMLWGGVAYYDSKLLPHAKVVADKGDQIAQCVAAGKKYGIEVHPWKVNWNLSNAPKEFVDQMRAEKRMLVNSKGETEPWLCASNPKNLQLEIDTMLEVALNYDVDGVHFDYIRYPHNDGCFCDGCRERFEAKLGRKVENWPADCQKALREEWMQFRCDNITALVKAVSEQAHKAKPGLKISAAVFSNYPNCKYEVGQDWVKWCKAGYLDFVCPMNYFEGNTQFANTVANQLAWVGNSVPLYSGIGSFINTDDNSVAQMELARAAGADGFILFNMGKDLAVQGFPKFAEGITSAPAILPHNGPQVKFTCGLDADAKATVLAGGKFMVTVEMVSAGQHRQKVAGVTGQVELQDATGKKLANLGDLPKMGRSLDVNIVTNMTGLLRLAAIGTLTFADGTKAPFVVRSRGYVVPAAK
ncbi:MAG: family 10 glycosylhydrolase, partial [Armatimonadota bacterium]